jgi:hypothetical protein
VVSQCRDPIHYSSEATAPHAFHVLAPNATYTQMDMSTAAVVEAERRLADANACLHRRQMELRADRIASVQTALSTLFFKKVVLVFILKKYQQRARASVLGCLYAHPCVVKVVFDDDTTFCIREVAGMGYDGLFIDVPGDDRPDSAGKGLMDGRSRWCSLCHETRQQKLAMISRNFEVVADHMQCTIPELEEKLYDFHLLWNSVNFLRVQRMHPVVGKRPHVCPVSEAVNLYRVPKIAKYSAGDAAYATNKRTFKKLVQEYTRE